MKFHAVQDLVIAYDLSAPTRGPWIEIDFRQPFQPLRRVGPHTGAVD